MSPRAYVVAGQVALGVYALLLIAGGITGYVKAGSRPSLVAGAVGGTLSVVSLALTWMGGFGFWIGAITATLLLIVFAMRLRATRKFMPSGLLLAASAVVLLLSGLAIAHVG